MKLEDLGVDLGQAEVKEEKSGDVFFDPITGEHSHEIKRVEYIDKNGSRYVKVESEVISPKSGKFNGSKPFMFFFLWRTDEYAHIPRNAFATLYDRCGLDHKSANLEDLEGKKVNVVWALQKGRSGEYNGRSEPRFFNSFDLEKAGRRIDPEADGLAKRLAGNSGGSTSGNGSIAEDDVPF